MSVTVRFAPSPTGKLHVGNVRTALMNWLFVKSHSEADTGPGTEAVRGQFILRIDDTDTERSTQAFEDGIKTDLSCLGLTWDRTFNQSERFDLYERAAQTLKDAGLLYPCYETSEDLDRQRKLLRVQGKPPIYNRQALELTDAERSALEAAGRQPHWRFKLSGDAVTWVDVVRGEQRIETASISDPVLIRADGSFLYTLPSVVDDIDAKITHVIRGEDHVTNSGAQIEIFRALSDHVPQFPHTPLLVGRDGKGLSKRLGSLSMDQLRGQGIEPMAITSLLGKIGTSDAIEARPNLETLAGEFAFSKIGRAPARFDEDELLLINSRLLHETDFADIKDAVSKLDLPNGTDTEALWALVRANIQKVPDVSGWAQIIYAPLTGDIAQDDASFCQEAADSLPDTIDAGTWSAWTASLKEITGRKGKSLFMPLRRALTGQSRGPDMGALLALLGADRAKARLRGEHG